MTFREVEKRLRQDGFEFSHARGSHYHYKHPDGPRVVVPWPGRRSGELAIGTLRNIYRQAGWDWRTKFGPRAGRKSYTHHHSGKYLV